MTETKAENKVLEQHGNRVVVRHENEKGIVEKIRFREVTKAKRFDTESQEAQRQEKVLVREAPGFSVNDSADFLIGKVSAEKHKLHMDMMLKEREDAIKYGRRCRTLQELWDANKRGVAKSFRMAEMLNPWQNRGVMVPKMNWSGPRKLFGGVQPVRGEIKMEKVMNHG